MLTSEYRNNSRIGRDATILPIAGWTNKFGLSFEKTFNVVMTEKVGSFTRTFQTTSKTLIDARKVARKWCR